ncbi:amidophosphoribosyltransferase [Vibrio sp. HA2012]|uniref:ComF family protein n=1 Tax=Vibrio sp. HA2012 TaxID=1971595 RepID=UPI000C2C610E|nr:ComF family protein [Vibrio sp. HA2012]PJC85191.1 amidophosphoribosyltransferase [Vibrio sp. HA2012]
MFRHCIHHHCTSLCHLCGLPLPSLNQTIWCPHCLNYFQPSPRCLRCGLPTLAETSLCGQCLSSPPPWQRLFCVGDYQFPLSGYIHQLKHQQKPELSRDLAYLLAPRISQPAPLITCVPLHWKRQLKRGFNQSERLSYYLSRELIRSGYPTRLDSRLFKRIKATPPQQGLDKKERESNLKDAFVLRHSPLYSHVAIVDDVVTTGSTIRHLCSQLLDVGVKTIDIYCVCRTPEPSSER